MANIFVCGTSNARRRPEDGDMAPTKKTNGPQNPNASEWDTTDVLSWLRQIQQADYSANFQRSNITGKRLLKLNIEDLKSMDIMDQADRKAIKKEISKLNKQQSRYNSGNASSNYDDTDNENKISNHNELTAHNNHNNGKSNRNKSKSPMNRNGRGGGGDRGDRGDRGDMNRGGGVGPVSDNNNMNNGFTKSQSDYGRNGMKSNNNTSQVEFSSQPPYGRGGFDSDTFADEKKLDKQKYYGVWHSLVGNEDILLQPRYNIIMKTSNLPQQDLSIIWRMATNYNQGKCQFEQFADICKLLHIAIYSGVPLYLINTQKLIWYHPKVPRFLVDPNQVITTMQNTQAEQFTVAFRGLPVQILESDDRLMKFAELALQDFEPVHFEINETTLIATFKRPITPNDLQTLRDSSTSVIQNKFNIIHVNGMNILALLQVEFPTALELGLTPDGNPNNNNNNNNGMMVPPPQGAPQQQQVSPMANGGYMGVHSQPNMGHGGYMGHGAPTHSAPQHQQMGTINGNNYGMQNGYNNGHATPYSQLNNGNNLPAPPPQQQQQAQQGVHNGYGPPPPQNGGPLGIHAQSPHYQSPNGHGQANGNNNNNNMRNGHNMNGYDTRTNGHYGNQNGYVNGGGMPPPQQQVPPHQAQPVINNGGMPIDNRYKQDQMNLLLSENFWEEFRQRTQIDKIVNDDDSKIRSKSAMSLIAALRQVPVKSVNYLDPGVKELSQRTKRNLRDEMNDWPLTQLAKLLNMPENEIPEVYKGIIIEGLPEIITASDETIRQLDSSVLFAFVVSHIEVVENILRITFKKDVSQQEIDKLRRELKKFLRDVMKIDKKSMKNVSLIPHTRETWKGETTATDLDYDDSQVHYPNDMQ